MTLGPLPSSQLTSLAPLVDLESTFGSFFVGAIASVGLSGVTTLQSWLYFQRYPQDSLPLKFLVLFLWAFEILRSAISIHAGYYYTVKHWGNLGALLTPIWSMKLMIMLTNVIEVVVHGFFIHKVWQTTYGRAKILCSVITLFALSDFAMGTTAFVTACLSSDYDRILRGTPSKFATAALGCAVGADWLITGSLVKFFRDSESQFPRTNRLLRKLIFYSVNVGLLTSLADVIVLVLSNCPWPTLNFYQLTVFEVVGNLYANSLLACLNARDMISEELEFQRQTPAPTWQSTPLGTLRFGILHNSQEHSSAPATTMSNPQLSENSTGLKPRILFHEVGIAS